MAQLSECLLSRCSVSFLKRQISSWERIRMSCLKRSVSPLSPEVMIALGVLKGVPAFLWATQLLKCCGFKLPAVLPRKLLLHCSHPVFMWNQRGSERVSAPSQMHCCFANALEMLLTSQPPAPYDQSNSISYCMSVNMFSFFSEEQYSI